MGDRSGTPLGAASFFHFSNPLIRFGNYQPVRSFIVVTVAILAQGTFHGQSTTCWPVFCVSPNHASGTDRLAGPVAILAQGTFHDQSQTHSLRPCSKPVHVYLFAIARAFFLYLQPRQKKYQLHKVRTTPKQYLS